MKNFALGLLFLCAASASAGEAIKVTLEASIEPQDKPGTPVRMMGSFGKYRGCRFVGTLGPESQAAKQVLVTTRVCPDGKVDTVALTVALPPPFPMPRGAAVVLDQ